MGIKFVIYDDFSLAFNWSICKGKKEKLLEAKCFEGQWGREFTSVVELAEITSKLIVQSLTEDNNQFSFWIFISQKIENPNGKIEDYLKIWKKTERSLNITFLRKSHEVVKSNNNENYYIGVAQFSISELSKMIEYQFEKYLSTFIFITTEDVEQLDKLANDLYETSFKEDSDIVYGINFKALSLDFCSQKNKILRIGSSGELVSMCIISGFLQNESQ